MLIIAMKRYALLISCSVLLASCGGGSSGVAVRPASTYRANQIGDSWTYTVSINFGQFGSYPGTLTEALTSDTYNGEASIRDSQTFHLALNTGPATISSYSEISPSGVLLAEMVNAVLYSVTSDTYAEGDLIGPTTSAGGVVTLSNGDTITESFHVEGAEWVQTPAGQYACWVASESVVNSNGTKDSFTLWIAPETGNYVRVVDKTLNPDGTGYTYTAALSSMITAPELRYGTTPRVALPAISIPRGWRLQ